MKVSPLLIIAVIGFGVWAYLGFPSRDTVMHLSSARAECVDFAEKHRSEMFRADDEIKPVDAWMKNGRIVVEIGLFKEGDTLFTPRLCVVRRGIIQIVSVLENSAWH
jgi:hypothetical protein